MAICNDVLVSRKPKRFFNFFFLVLIILGVFRDVPVLLVLVHAILMGGKLCIFMKSFKIHKGLTFNKKACYIINKGILSKAHVDH